MPLDVSRMSNSNIGSNRGASETAKSSEISRTSGLSDASGGGVSYGNLSKGQVFSGQITNISPNEITIALENGETMTAKYDNLSEISIGDGARFKVLGREDGQIVLKTLQSGSPLENVVYKALEASGLPFSAKNEELVTALLKNEYPVNRQMINGMLQQSLKNPDISMTNLVLMNKAGLDISPENSKVFEMYSTDRPELINNMNRTFGSMLDMINGLLSEGNVAKGAQTAIQMLDILNLGIEPDELVLTLAGDEVKTSAAKTLDTGSLTALLENLISEGDEALLNDKNLTDAAKLNSNTPISAILGEEQRLGIFAMFENSDLDVDASKLQRLINGQMTSPEFLELIKTLPEAEQAKLNALKDSLLSFAGRENPANSDLLSALLPQSASLSEAAEHIKNLLNSSVIPSDVKQALLKSGDFNKVLKMLIATDWTLSADEIAGKDAVNKLYNRMNEQINRLISVAENAGAAGAKLSTDLGQTGKNLNFMNEMNQLYNFVELPVRMNGQTATGDLYVYSDRHKKRSAEDGSISCLLHLDMKNLGGMNIRIELNGASVSTRFFLNDDSSGKLIAENLHELDSAILRQGFNPKSEVVKTSEKEEEQSLKTGEFNPINDFIPSEIENNKYTRYTFDVRA